MRDIYDILAKHFAGETSAQENALVDQWKADNEAEYNELSSAWNLIPDSFITDPAFKVYDHKAALLKIELRLNPEAKATRVFRMGSFMRYAAAACGAVLVGLGTLWLMSSGGTIEITNEAAEAKKIELPDGSTVWLAEASTIKYNEDFTNSRNLALTGEAFFEVEPDTSHPFVVETQSGNITVLGTAFNVETANGKTEVSVDHGLVALRFGKEEVKIAAGQSAISDKSGVSDPVKADVNYLSWKSGVFHFDNTSLEDVITEMNKFYPETITYDRMSTKNFMITGDFNNRPVEELIEVIVLTCGLNAEYGDGTISLE